MATGTPVTSKQLCLATETNLSIMQDCLNPDDNQVRFSFQAVRGILDNLDDTLLTSNAANQSRPGDASCPDRTVYMRYLKPDCDPIADTACTVGWDCDTTAETELEYETDPVTVDDCIEESFTVKVESFQCQCETDPITELQEKIKRHARRLAFKYQKKLVEKMHAGVGTHYDGTTTTAPLNIYDDNFKPQPRGMFHLQNEYSKQNPNCAEQPILITGSEKFNSYNCDASVFRGNLDGFDPNMSCYNLGNVYFDRQVQQDLLAIDPALTDGVIAFLPGTYTIAEYYDFESTQTMINPAGRSIFAPMQNSGSVLRQKVDIGSSTLGFPLVVDMQIVYKECEGLGGTVTYRMKKTFDLCQIPQGAFCSTYNYSTLWNVECGTVTC